ncbi:MAG: ferritin family protein [Clostridiales bacterium]|jgi:rubrerythrin|nr:ferritin family protein [Clostridiales bacterium]
MIQTNFNDLEAVKIAIQIEERGEAFYERSIPLVSNDEVKNMLAELAEQERDHAAAFREIYNELVKKERSFDDDYLYDPEVSAYLRSMAESSIFPSDDKLDEIMQGIKDVKDVLTIGIQAEKDSILYYTEMIINAKYVEAKEAFRRLLKEEKKHLTDLQTQLNKLKKES